MNLSRRAAAIALVAEFVSTGAGSQTIDNRLSDQSWSTFAYISVSVVVQDGAVRIQSEAGGAGDSGLVTKCTLNGDFDVQADYRLLDWPPQNGHSVGLVADDVPRQTETTAFFVSTIFTSTGVGVFRSNIRPSGQEAYLLVTGNASPQRATTESAGTLRLARRGNTVSGYSGASAGWTQIGSGAGSAGPTHISIRLTRPGPTTSHASVSLENFVLNAGRVSCPPSK